MIRATLTGVVTATLAAAVCAQDGPRVEVVPLWGEHYRPGRMLPVALRVESPTAPVSGTVHLEVDGGPAVQLAASLAAGGRVARLVPVIAHGAAPQLRASFVGAHLAATTLHRAAADTALVGMLLGDADVDWAPVRLVASARCAAEPWRATALPDRAAWYDVVDTCLLGRLPGDAFDTRRAMALATWCRAGGRVLLTDPDLLRRSPALDAALFDPAAPDEDLAAMIPGLPAHYAAALRQRGLGTADLVFDRQRRPHHVRFTLGAGGGALLLATLDDDAARAAYEALLAELAIPDPSAPTLAPTVVAAFAPAAPGGWGRLALALWLCAVPAVAWASRWGGRTVLVASAVATLGAMALTLAALRPVATLLPIVTDSESRWIVHVAAPRAAVCDLRPFDAGLCRPLYQRLAEAARPGGHWDMADGALRGVPLARGVRAAWEVLGGAPPAGRLRGSRTGSTVLLSNESGTPLTACVLAWRGGLLDCGALDVGAVTTVELPERLPGPIATLRAVGRGVGPEGISALRAAAARLDARRPTLLALAPGLPLDAPTITGASLRRLPAVLVTPIA